MGRGVRVTGLALYGGLRGLGKVQHDGLGPGGKFVRQVTAALRGKEVYVLNAAYTTAKDPNLLLATLNGHR